MSDTVASFNIGQPPAELRRLALVRAYEGLPDAQRAFAVEETSGAAAQGERSLDGLFAAWRNSDVAAALWTEIHPGASASLWPPQLSANAPRQLSNTLVAKALAWLAANGVELVQTLLETDAGEDAERLVRAGFEHSCDLLYLVSDASQFPTAALTTKLTFDQLDADDLDDLAKLVEQTYERTLDCPALDARRDCRQVLAGYRANCHDDLSQWFVARHSHERVGCLLLGHDASGKTWELVYMGVVPAARGQGWGLDMVRHAQWLVAQRNGERLVLAVDAANAPALGIYAAAGFQAWDRRSVFLKWLSSTARGGE